MYQYICCVSVSISAPTFQPILGIWSTNDQQTQMLTLKTGKKQIANL